MNYVGASLVTAWIAGALCLEEMYWNDIRRGYNNNFVPDALPKASIYRLGSDCTWHFRFSRIDPALLTETGRICCKKAAVLERLRLAWHICSFIVKATFCYRMSVSPSGTQTRPTCVLS
jgi:hypothetical protein